MSRLDELEKYLTGELPDGPAADALEEALFDAPDDPDLALLDTIATRGRVLAKHGTFDMGVTLAHIEALRAQGVGVGVIDCGPPGISNPVFSGEGDVVCTLLRTGRRDLGFVDVEIVLVEHSLTKVIRDVAVDPADGNVYALCERPLAEIAFGAGRTIARVRRRDGARDVLAEWDVQQ